MPALLGNKTPPLLPKKPKAAFPVPDAVDTAKKESKPVPEPQISLPETKLIPPEAADSKSTPPAASEAQDKNDDFDSVPRADLLGAPMRPKAPRRRPPSAVLKLNGHSDSFEDKTDTGDNEVRVAPARLSAELRAAVPFKEATPPRPEDLPKEALREPTKIEMKKSPFMEELKGAVNQVGYTFWRLKISFLIKKKALVWLLITLTFCVVSCIFLGIKIFQAT